MDELILEPLKYYNSRAKEKHRQNVSDHFDSLVSKAGVDIDQNRATVKRYNDQMTKVNKVNSKIRKHKVVFGLLIALGVIGIVGLVIGGMTVSTRTGLGLGLCFGSVAVIITAFIIAFKVVRSRIKNAEKIRDELLGVANQIKAEAAAQMAPLNALFNSSDTHALIEKTMPELNFHTTYTQQHQDLLVGEYDYVDLTDDETSVIDTISGEFFGNPFLYERYIEHYMGTQSYTGTLVISWTETRRDSKGNLRTVHRTQTLHATVVKPKPYYKVMTHLGFGSQAAPDLSFTRTESDTDELSDKALARRIRKGEKELTKRAQKAATTGGDFQEMANSEFEVLFGAHNRNHEVQFRVMFTPLAQQNTVDLLRSKDGYGDDFNFIKQGRYNIIRSNHAQSWLMNTDVSRFQSYDIDASRQAFLSFNCEYFRSVFFDFAPLMAIPAYQAKPVPSMRKPTDYSANYTQYEHECMANAIGAEAFAHPETRTQSILKTSIVAKNGEVDRVKVTAYSYATAERVDLVSVLGGDGRFHLVPVPWIEYLPRINTRDMAIKVGTGSNTNITGGARKHGLTAITLSEQDGWDIINQSIQKYL